MYTNTPRNSNGQFKSFNGIGNIKGRAEGAIVVLALTIFWKLGKHIFNEIKKA